MGSAVVAKKWNIPIVDIDMDAGIVTEETMDDILHMESESGGGREAERLLGP